MTKDFGSFVQVLSQNFTYPSGVNKASCPSKKKKFNDFEVSPCKLFGSRLIANENEKKKNYGFVNWDQKILQL